MKFTDLCKTTGLVLLAGLTSLVAAEFTARFDDWLFEDVPLLASPGREDLFTQDTHGRRGRPHGRYKKWHLNSYGFRGPEINLQAQPGCIRIVVIGASETFGLYESPDKEYPAQLGAMLAAQYPHTCTEVINTAVVGMTLGSMRDYWKYQVAQFRPNLVLIYPSSNFYLAMDRLNKPEILGNTGNQSSPDRPILNPDIQLEYRSRFIGRLRDVFSFPPYIQIYRDQITVQRAIAAEPKERLFSEIPEESLEMFKEDLTQLVIIVKESGARPVLITHAIRATDPPRSKDLPDLWSARVFIPRVNLNVIVPFEHAANAIMTQVAKDNNIQIIDSATSLNGCRECFGDLVHFSDLGARRFSSLIAKEIDLEGF